MLLELTEDEGAALSRSATHRPNQVASPRAALSARRAHRFGWIDVLNLPSSSGERPCPSNAIRPQPNAWFRSVIRSSTGWESLPRRLRSWVAQNPCFCRWIATKQAGEKDTATHS